MSAATAQVLRPAPPASVKTRLTTWALDHFDLFARVLRRVWPIPGGFGLAAVLRFEDVAEVFANDRDFPVEYDGKLAVIMGGHPFFLGMGDTAEYRRDTAMLRQAMLPGDIQVLADRTVALAEQAVAAGGGQVEVVQMVRDITFGVLCPYFGVEAPAGENLQVWATRLFEFQFADPGNDPELRHEVDRIAPLLRAHVDSLIAARKQADGPDDMLGRCLALQVKGVPSADDAGIRTALMGLVVGGPPQPPMVVPQALDQLLRRPDELERAQAAARAGKDVVLAGFVHEALRFDPLAPGPFRRAACDTTIAVGTWRARRIAAGTRVFVAFRSAMHDGRFVTDPAVFDPARPADHYIHFGHGLHTCFGIHLNRVLLPLMLKPLLARRNLRRAEGADGQLSKRGGFADRLMVRYD